MILHVKCSKKMFASTLIIASIVSIATSMKEPGVCGGKLCPGGVYDLCVKCPTPCPKTCDKPIHTGACPMFCLENGCECADGFVRDSKGNCIRLDDCPKPAPGKCCKPCKGGKHDRCVACGTKCPVTCDNLGAANDACTAECVLNVCQCNPGYARAPDGRCVLPENCPANPLVQDQRR